jgi:DNA topoisomerase-1
MESFLTPDQYKLYDLIWRRFVASQMSDAQYDATNVSIRAGKGVFKAKGRVCAFDGHTKISGASDDKDLQGLPALDTGDKLDLLELDPQQHFTKPPPRFAEASLIRTLEREGIGRPSTYSSIISTIQQRGYVNQEKRAFHATDLGIVVTDLLVEGFPRIMDVQFTSEMEEKLDGIEEDDKDWVAVLEEFYKLFKANLDKAQDGLKAVKGAIVEGEVCPDCGKPMTERWSKFGRFLGCSGYPECKYIKPNEGDGPTPEVSDVVCSKCGKPMALKVSRWGKFLGCSGYPECKNTLKIGPDGKPLPPPEPTDEVCEKCGAQMLIRTTARGRFMACSAFPKCRNKKSLPTGVKCGNEGCDGELVYKRGGGRKKGCYICTKAPECDYTTPELPKKEEAEASAEAEAPAEE